MNKHLLTGKCLEDFQEWLFDFFQRPDSKSDITARLNVVSFSNLPLSMRFGVIQDFADNFGVFIDIFKGIASKRYYYELDGNHLCDENEDRFNALNDAREKAIIEFNHVYNLHNEQ